MLFSLENNFKRVTQKILINNWGISSTLIIEAAKKAGLQVEVISKEKNLFSVQKADRKVYFKSVDCGINSSFGLKAANDKELTYLLGEENAVKVPKSIYLNKGESIDIETVKASLELPVISKPIDGAHGDGVYLNINSQDDLEKALKYSFEGDTNRIVIQEQIAGDDHRVIVVGNKVVAATKRMPPSVVGDGKNTIKHLINIENMTPDRVGKDHENKMSPIKIDSELENCIKEHGYSLESVLEDGKEIFVRKNANLSSGGSAIDVTDIIHEENKQQCIKLAQILGLNMCGVDIFSSDISKAMNENKGAIIEVNGTPGIRMHHFPSKGEQRNVAGEIIAFIFQK